MRTHMTWEKRGKYTDKHTRVFRMNNMYSKEIEKRMWRGWKFDRESKKDKKKYKHLNTTRKSKDKRQCDLKCFCIQRVSVSWQLPGIEFHCFHVVYTFQKGESEPAIGGAREDRTRNTDWFWEIVFVGGFTRPVQESVRGWCTQHRCESKRVCWWWMRAGQHMGTHNMGHMILHFNSLGTLNYVQRTDL